MSRVGAGAPDDRGVDGSKVSADVGHRSEAEGDCPLSLPRSTLPCSQRTEGSLALPRDPRALPVSTPDHLFRRRIESLICGHGERRRSIMR